ncbi:Lrp/AsnC family transcriptional regulator [Agaribacter flavus]|uniref:Lrp/AsnC family transcriptional regulator n=1 Tax=Agaribacter flavus TaxID=1902781 RepID=A0ABV7FU76_9ALTE
MIKEKSRMVDYIDTDIINALEKNARVSFSYIGKKLEISGPAVGERVKRLKDKQVIDGFGVRINLETLGYSIVALVRIKPISGQHKAVEKAICQQTRFMSCDRVTGSDCYVAKLALVNVAELDDILSTLHKIADTDTSIIKSSLIDFRLPPLIPK